MIEWAEGLPSSATPAFIDAGATVRGATNGAGVRVNRLGSHYRAAITMGIGSADQRKRLITDLILAKQEGLRLPYPLQGVNQGYPGAPVVDGAGQAGKTINLRGLTPQYVAEKGFWLTIYAADGQGYLHNASQQCFADNDGKIALKLSEMLRTPFPDGALVELASPTIEGEILGNEQSWQLVRGGRMVGIQFTIEEMG